LILPGQLFSGATVPVRRLRDVNGRSVEVPARAGRTHLQFRRFAGCRVCHLHLCSFGNRQQEVAEAGITDVVLLHSPNDELRRYQSLLPFTVVADPDWMLYREFAMETGLQAIADPRAWWAADVGPRSSATHLGLPADFLIEPDGTVLAAHYGSHADDQWSVDHLLDVHRSFGHEKAS
jgi:peroxiredoxin